jgi:hypothetical protein
MISRGRFPIGGDTRSVMMMKPERQDRAAQKPSMTVGSLLA